MQQRTRPAISESASLGCHLQEFATADVWLCHLCWRVSDGCPPCCAAPDAEWYAVITFLRELPASTDHDFSDCFEDARSWFSSACSSCGSDAGDVVEALSPRSAAAAARQAARERIPRSLVPKGAAAPWVPQPALQFAGEGLGTGGSVVKGQLQQPVRAGSSAARHIQQAAGGGQVHLAAGPLVLPMLWQ
jgi:hypothetical protein